LHFSELLLKHADLLVEDRGVLLERLPASYLGARLCVLGNLTQLVLLLITLNVKLHKLGLHRGQGLRPFPRLHVLLVRGRCWAHLLVLCRRGVLMVHHDRDIGTFKLTLEFLH